MLCPENLYIAALSLTAAVEWVFFVTRIFGATSRHAFGRVTWVIVAVAVSTYCADRLGMNLPAAQLALHSLAFIAGLIASRNLPGHIATAIFLPLASVDLCQIAGMVTPLNWWWAVWMLAMGQLIVLGAGADFHPIGKAMRAWGQRMTHWYERRSIALWRA